MEKGIIKIKKSGSAELKRSDGKKIPVPRIFDLSDYFPETGSNPLDCEYEADQNGNPTQIIIQGKALAFKSELLEEKKQKEERLNEKLKIEAIRKEEKLKCDERLKLLSNDSVKIADFPEKFLLPKDTNEKLQGNECFIENNCLKLNKCARFEKKPIDDSKPKFVFFKTNHGKIDYKIEFKPVTTQEMINGIVHKNEQNALGLCKSNLKSMTFKPDWRMVVGLGSESVYETSMTLHHVYGIPYIPGSSIKGVVRSWIITELFGSKATPAEEIEFPLVNAEYRALMNSEFCKVFGCPKNVKRVRFSNGNPERTRDNKYKYEDTEPSALKKENRGNVIFFDAFPINIPAIEPDIMNVHYPEYYGANQPPTDFQNPNPILFLTVKDAPFQFLLGSVNDELDKMKIKDRNVMDWLKEALEEHGIGAKTAAGYGKLLEYQYT